MPSSSEVERAPELAVIAGLPIQLQLARRALLARYHHLLQREPSDAPARLIAAQMVDRLQELAVLAQDYLAHVPAAQRH